MLVKDLKQVYTADSEFYGGWYSYHLHGLAHNFTAFTDPTSGMQINTVTDWLNCWFGYYLQPLRDSRSLWCDSYRNVAKYGQERDTATLTVEENGTDGFSVSIHDMMDDTIFTQALTVKIMVDSTWTDVTATNADGEGVNAELHTTAEGTFVFVDVVPDTGIVTVNAVK